MSEKNDYEVVGIFSSVEELDQAVDELFVHGFNQASLSVLANEEKVQQQLGKNYNRLLSNLASGREFEGGLEHGTGVYTEVHEDSSTEPTYKLSAEVEFRKKSNKVDDLADDPHTARTAFYAEENISIAKGAVIGGLMYIGVIMVTGLIIMGEGSVFSKIVMVALVAVSTTIIGVLLINMISNHREKHLKRQLKKGGLLLWVHLKDKSQKDMAIKVLQNNNARNAHLHRLPINFFKSQNMNITHT